MDNVEFWKQWEIIAGLMTMAFGVVYGVVKWFERRGQARVDRTKDDLTRDADAKVGALETKIISISDQVAKVAGEVEEIEGRVVGVEKTLETVARTDSVNSLAIAIARLEAHSQALGGKMDTLYRAAIEAGTQTK
jgi:predicted  nucleic acid-binding Zn-ribbon protein